ncbi:hypothetical protein SAMN05421737_109120 [Shouchella lonarensis]|uniref:Uncharacterized protein n=1 Tax=Shouchella lonarensis TaxID=1464122 RepID=A0A1G6M9E5_9BACI|nr:hypothetical protein SAMN05421737_109120 [Shouchella lonarensis]
MKLEKIQNESYSRAAFGILVLCYTEQDVYE